MRWNVAAILGGLVLVSPLSVRQDAVNHTLKTTSSDLHTLISNMGLIFADSIEPYAAVAAI
eukprot:6926278-Pyramimonas_sp.AAC.2